MTHSWSDEDKLLDAAYTGYIKRNGLSVSVDAPEFNRKLREGTQLTETEQAIVQHFTDCATPLGKDTDLYRMVGLDYVTSMLGVNPEYVAGPNGSTREAIGDSIKNNISSLNGREIVSNQLQSTAPAVQNYFKEKQVAIKIKTPGDVPVCLTADASEGEIVIPAGARMRITKAEHIPPIEYKYVEKQVTFSNGKTETVKDRAGISNDPSIILPEWHSGRLARSVSGFPGIGTKNTIRGGFDNSNRPINAARLNDVVYIEMELMGYE
jgi:hypothetical protein